MADINNSSGEQAYNTGKEITPIECFRCGICCVDYYPQVTTEDIEPIARQLSISIEKFISRYIIQTLIGYLFRHTEEGCVFLTREKNSPITSCSIYAFRPEVCRNMVPSLSHRQCREGLELLKRYKG